ncbi:MAG TPA: DsbA family protein [Pseudolabrys sp.]|jgi:predicted DsbA family dithiol-disulfide isomerase|nr:DsbA family protein [Pseudolabrys sp.]
MSVVEITYFSDVLCVWAYVAQARINAIEEQFGANIRIEYRFCSVFGDTARKIPSTWKDKRGYEGFNAHLRQVAERFPHIQVHPEIWLKTRPLTSASAHLFLKALQQWQNDSGVVGRQSAPRVFDQVMWAFRCAFFRDCRDISCWDIQCEIAEALGADIGAIEERIHSGIAFAHLAADTQDADKMRIEGSPSFVLNEGRQKLYGNIGFRLMEANIQELFRAPRTDEASWC